MRSWWNMNWMGWRDDTVNLYISLGLLINRWSIKLKNKNHMFVFFNRHASTIMLSSLPVNDLSEVNGPCLCHGPPTSPNWSLIRWQCPVPLIVRSFWILPNVSLTLLAPELGEVWLSHQQAWLDLLQASGQSLSFTAISKPTTYKNSLFMRFEAVVSSYKWWWPAKGRHG